MLRIETHAPGSYTISGYHPIARRNDKGQIVVTNEVCQIVFADEGENNGITPEILMELIAKHTGNAPSKAGPKTFENEDKKQAQRDRMAAARAAKKKPEPAVA